VTQLSANFGLAELSCNDRDATTVPQHLIPNARRVATKVAQPIRDRWAAPLIVVSGYRTIAWNLRVGGAQSSTHLTVDGWDVRPVYLRDVPRLHDLILSMHAHDELPDLGGLGKYPAWVHIDTRQAADGHLRRWNGGGLGSEPG